MKKDKIISMFLIMTFILTYLCFKIVLITNYKVDIKKIGDNLHKSGEKITITKNNIINKEEIEVYKDFTYKKIEGNLYLDETLSNVEGPEIYSSYYINKNDNGFSAMFKLGVSSYSLYDIFSSDDIFVYGLKLKNLNRKKLLDKNKIFNDYDIIQYILDHNNDKVNIFSSANKIKMNYFMKTFGGTVIPTSKIHLLEGEYKGFIYVINDGNYYEVNLLHNNKNYIFSFANKDEDYFDLGFVVEFISNINFDSV